MKLTASKPHFVAMGALTLVLAAQGASAGEVYGGIYGHDMSFFRDVLSVVGTDPKTYESGTDLEIGWRSDPIESWTKLRGPSIYVNAQFNSEGTTNQADVGLTWKIPFGESKKYYVRPAIGLAVHDGRLHTLDPDEPGITPEERTSRLVVSEPRGEYSSRLMINWQMGLGYDLTERTSAELSWVHFSHAGLGGEVNQGQDNLGFRLNYRY